jgi:hypothetical protein
VSTTDRPRTEYNGNAYTLIRDGLGVRLVTLRIEDGIVVGTMESEPDILGIQTSKITSALRKDLGI